MQFCSSTSTPETPRAYKSSDAKIDFQTPDSLPYSTPPQERRLPSEEEASAGHLAEEDGAQLSEDGAASAPLARKHKLLKYVQRGETRSNRSALIS